MRFVRLLFFLIAFLVLWLEWRSLSEHPEDGFLELSTVTLSSLSWVVTAHSELFTPTPEQAREKQAWESPGIY